MSTNAPTPTTLFHQAERRAAIGAAAAWVIVGLGSSGALIEFALRRSGDTSGHMILFGVPLTLVATMIGAYAGAQVWLGRRYRALYGED